MFSKNKKASLGFIFTTVLIDVIGIAIIIPVAPALVQELTGLGVSDSAPYVGWLMASYALMQFLFSPLMGSLSDTYGRRPILLISLFGLGLDYILHALAPTITWLFVGRLMAGMCGASFTVANAYIADISSKKERAKNFGMIGAAFGVGFILGPVIGGFAASQWGIRAPFIVAAVLSFLNFLYGFFILPESFPKEKRRTFNFKNANPVGSLLHIRKYPMLIGLVVTFFLLHFAGESLPATWVLFTEFQFGWEEGMIGLSLGVVGLLVAIVQGGLIGKFVSKFGDKKTVYIGFVFWIIGMFLFALASEPWMIFAFSIPYCLGGIAGPTLQGIISNQVSDDEQGELQGALTSLMSLTTIISPLIMTWLFKEFTREERAHHIAGAPYILAALVMIISFIMVMITFNKRAELLIPAKNEEIPEPTDDQEIGTND